jgi:coenzyme PQQ synthesis protein D (PqqD)
MIPVETRPAHAESVLAQRSGDSLVLLSPQSGHYYTLDEVGARVWELCDGSRSVDDVVASVHAEYDAPLDVIRSDVLELLEDLRVEHLLAAS